MSLEAKTVPIVESILYQLPQKLFEIFAHTPWNMLIDSSDAGRKAYGTNRYSYILVDPFEQYSYHSSAQEPDPLMRLRAKILSYQLKNNSAIPPFQGGIAGYLSYDLAHVYHAIPRCQNNDLDYPEIGMGFYDLVCSFDHLEQKAYIVSSGLPEREESARLIRAQKRLNWFKQKLELGMESKSRCQAKRITNSDIQSNFTKDQYVCAVKKAIEYIRAGDIFEVNLAQRFSTILTHASHQDYYELYKRLSKINPSPFSGFLNFGDRKIISASPERFMLLQNRQVETRPIKGTRARCANSIDDALAINNLLNSEKDFSENIMIVDLMRNDLSIVCEDDSVVVTQLCGHEIYPTVHHLVSVIKGCLKESEDAISLLRATFPGGSITGAPKIRAMQIIAELEPHNRGPYCGSIAFIGFDGNMDSSILIRSYVIKNDMITFHAGGAVVLDSNPLEEYEETLSKSFALRKALCEDVYDTVD